MRNIRNKKNKVTADEIAEMADSGKDVTKFFKKGKMNLPLEEVNIAVNVQRVNVDFAKPMLNELDGISQELNVSRQSLIKTWLRESLDKYYEHKKLRKI